MIYFVKVNVIDFYYLAIFIAIFYNCIALRNNYHKNGKR